MNTTTIFTAAAAFAATVATFGIADVALAKGEEAPRQLSLDVSAVDFDNAASVDALHTRIRRAARQVCDTNEGTGHARSSQEEQCFRKAVNQANQRIAELRGTASSQTSVAVKSD